MLRTLFLTGLLFCVTGTSVVLSPGLLASEREESEVEVGYDKGFYLQTRGGAQRLKLYGYMQALWTAVFDNGSLETNEFRVRRGRLLAAGNLLKLLEFKLHVDFTSSNPLLDYYLDFKPFSAFCLRVGQYKTPLARQFLVSATKKQFVDDTIATGAFKLDRDIGLMVHGSVGKGRFEYQMGVFNGSGKNSRQDNTDFQYVTRLAVHPLGPSPATESDISSTSPPRFSVGVAFGYNKLELDWDSDETTPLVATDRFTVAGEAAFYFHGLFSAWELFLRLDNSGEAGGVGGENRSSMGGYFQTGYLVVPRHVEIGIRGALVREDTSFSDRDQWEAGGVLNWFVLGHRLKLQLDYTALMEEIPGESLDLDHRIRLQLQGVF